MIDSMRRERLSIDDLLTSAREAGILRYGDVDLAVLESNGRISFFTRTSEEPSGAAEQPPAGV